ncbi:hypothetical protein PEP31012_03814 [Pandoraea eparura]|uniref:Uncharacterized protein n=1 Tax=Pandoraea eparura TaxID=2508291 RepID=A0A5E4XBH6_9BURK|nr:hypothetical protein PEP31012_03814 [Pandoraea eparura]
MAVAGPGITRSYAGGPASDGDCAADAAVCSGAGGMGDRSALAQCGDASGAFGAFGTSGASGARRARWARRAAHEGGGSRHALVCRAGPQKRVLRGGAHLASGRDAGADPAAPGGGRWRRDAGLGGARTRRRRDRLGSTVAAGACRRAGEPSRCAVSQASRAAPSRTALADLARAVCACPATGDGG